MASNLPATDKTGRCIGHSFPENEGLEDTRCLLRDGDVLSENNNKHNNMGAVCGPHGSKLLSESNAMDDGVAYTDTASSNQPVGQRERALKALRRDLEDSRAGRVFDRPGRTDPYRKVKQMRQSGRMQNVDETGQLEASGGPASPGGYQDSSSDTVDTGSFIHSQDPRYWLSDDDTQDDKSYSSTTSSLFWSTPHYDTNKLPSVLVSGTSTEDEPDMNPTTPSFAADKCLAVDMDYEYAGSTAVHRPEHAGELLSLLNIMRESGDLVDTQVYATGCKPLSGHKAILAAGSPYFSNIIESCSNINAGKTLNLEIDDIRLDLVSQLVEFIYTAKICISNQNAQELLQQSYNKKHLFLGKSVDLACSEYLTGRFLAETGSETSSSTGMGSSALSLEEEGPGSFPDCCHHDRNYPLEIIYALNNQRKQRQLTDLVLKVEEEEFYCHRAVLIAVSPYFRAMLTSDMRESIEEEVTLYDIRASVFTRLIDFVYTCRLYLNEDNVQDVMELACFLQLTPAISACSQFLKDQLAISNCFGILNFAYMYNCSELYNAAMNFAQNDFLNATATSEEFQDLEPAILASLVADDHLNVAKEETVYEAVMLWLKGSIPERLPRMPSIMKHVRLPLLDQRYFRNVVEKETLLTQSPECEILIKTAKELRETSVRGKHSTDPRLKLRFSMKTQVMVIVGGYDDNQTWVRDVWCFIPPEESWISLAPFPGRNRRFGCIALNNDIYVIGGQSDHGAAMAETIADVWRYDAITDSWSEVASMNKPRHGHGLATVDGKIYAVGGKMGFEKGFNDVERYDPSSNLWTCVTRIKGSYLDIPCCTSLDGKLYVNGYFFREPDIMYCYNPVDGSWESMYSFKRLHGDGIENAVALHDFLYFMVYRGYDNYVIIYNPTTGEHMRGSVMPDGKYLYSYGLTVIGDKLYIAGGSKLDASINVSYIQCYDPALDMWGVVGSIPYPLCEHGCVTIEKYISK